MRKRHSLTDRIPRLLYRVYVREDKIYIIVCKIHNCAARTATLIIIKDFSKLRGHKGRPSRDKRTRARSRDGFRIYRRVFGK